MQDTETIRILVVEPRGVIASGISTILRGYSDFNVVGQVKNGEDALKFMSSEDPDVISMDIDLPGAIPGLDLIRRVQVRFPHTRIIILTNLLEDASIREALRLGAAGYLLKNVTADELIQAIRAVCQGTVVLSPEVAQLLTHEAASPHQYHITPREYQVLDLLVKGRNNHDIARELNISLSTVQFHVSNILEKLEVHNRIEAATLAVRRNLATYPAFPR